MWKTECFPLRSRGTGISALTPPIRYWTRALASTVRYENEVKDIQTGKKEEILFLFTDNVIVYVENPKASTKKLLELISEFSKVQISI